MKMNIIDRVTMKESILSRVMSKPFVNPLRQPNASARVTPSHTGRPQVSRQSPSTTVVMLPMAPTERFIPPTTRQMACASAIRT